MQQKQLEALVQQVENEWQMGGLAGTMYGEFAIEVAKLAVAAEREACAKACEEVDLHSGDHLKNSDPRVTCAAAIRAR